MRTPRIHSRPVPAGYASVSVDRAKRGCGSVPLEIEGGDGEKTLGEAEKTFICWRKRFLIIPGVPLSPLPHHRFLRDSYIIYVLHFKKVCSQNSLFPRQGLIQPKSCSFRSAS